MLKIIIIIYRIIKQINFVINIAKIYSHLPTQTILNHKLNSSPIDELGEGAKG